MVQKRDEIRLKVCCEIRKEKQGYKKATLGVVNYMYTVMVENIG